MKKIIPLIFSGTLLTHATVYAAADTALEDELKYLQAEKAAWIEVVSKQKEDKNAAAGIVSIVTRDEIERYGGNNLFEILNRVTSITMLGSNIYPKGTISMRGDFSDSTDGHVLILMNGRPFRDSVFGGYNELILRDFPIHHLQQIEIIRGPGSALYGTNAYSAVINLVTQNKKDTAVTLRGRYGSYQTGQVESEFAFKNNDVALTGALRYRTSQGSQSTFFHGTPPQGTSFRMSENDESASLTAEWRNFSLNGFIAHSPHYNGGPGLTPGGHPVEQERAFLDLGYKKVFNPNWTSQWNVTYNQLADEQQVSYFCCIPQSFNPIHTFTRTSENTLLFEQTQFLNFFDKKLNFLIGGLVEWQTGRINQVTAGNTLPTFNHLRSSIYGEISYALLQDLPFVHNLKLTAGGQWHRLDHLEKNATNTDENNPIEGKVGRLGLVYEITPKFGLKFLYSQAFRAPAVFDLEINATIIQGSRNIQPERVETLDAQIFYHTPDYQASFTAFRSRQSQFVTILCGVPNCFPLRFANSDSAVYQGFELETQATLRKGLQWKGAYTFQTNRDGNGQNNPSTQPNHSAKIGLSYDVNLDFQLSAFYTFLSQAKIIAAQNQVNPLPGNDHLLSINSQYRLNSLLGMSRKDKPINFSFYVDNILNEKTYYPVTLSSTNRNAMPGNPGRTFFGELAITF